MGRRGVIAVALGAALALPASAQAALAGHEYGGGALHPAYRPYNHPDNVSAAVRVFPDGQRVIVVLGVYASCGRGRVSRDKVVRTTALAADGSFSVTGSQRAALGHGARNRYTIAGRVDESAGAGTARFVITGAHAPAGYRHCDSGVRPWAVRRAQLDPGAPTAAPRPATTYLGLMRGTQGTGAAPPLALRVSADGRSVTHARWSAGLVCSPRRLSFGYDNITPPATIRSGRFSHPEHFTIRYSNVVERYAITFRGRFTDAGATGVMRVRVVGRAPRSGRVIERCDSGALVWTATP